MKKRRPAFLDDDFHKLLKMKSAEFQIPMVEVTKRIAEQKEHINWEDILKERRKRSTHAFNFRL